MWPLLNADEFNGKQIINSLSEDTETAELFEAPAGVWEGYSIREHTELVFKNFEAHYKNYKTHYGFNISADIRLWPLLKIIIALHDIGKPLAIADGDKQRQHFFTLKILETYLEKFDFNTDEIQLANALVGHDHIGKLLKAQQSMEKTVNGLIQAAEESKLEMRQFFPLQAFYFCIDAAAYPSLMQRIFTVRNSLLVPIHPEYTELHTLMMGQTI